MKKIIYTKEHIHAVEQLKKARIEAGLSQEKVAKLLKTTQSYISKVESGQRRVDIIQLKKFAEIYKKNLDFFYK
jgi:transcriptional regulator with XRE-family HTH domain